MQYINHRINTLAQLKDVPIQNGIEIDIRYHNDDLVLHHDPFSHHQTQGLEKFEDFLKGWQHEGTMILNVKTEGVELKCIELMNRFNIQNWFFLDLSMPYFAIYAEKATSQEIDGFGINNLAVRFSEREAIEYTLGFSGKAKWVWVDCFTHLPLNADAYLKLKNAGFKICMVSPELQGHNLSEIARYRTQLSNDKIIIDAVCTKQPHLWGQNNDSD